jgi:hypothetical protein
VNKNRKLPREGVASRDDTDEIAQRDSDTEGHRAPAMPRLPGTGGDEAYPRRPSSGGELTDEDVEGHVRALPRLPGTGGDAFPRRPSSGGELTDEDDVEGHVR